MKILYHHRIASKDGQYVHIEELTKALLNRGHELIFVGPKVVENKKFGSNGGLVSFIRRILPAFISELLEYCYSFLAYRKLAKAVKKHKPDCLYERYNLFLPSGVWVSKKFNLPMLLEVNAPLYDERKKYNGISLNGLARWSERYAWKNADKVLPVTQVLAKRISEEDVAESKIVVIPNGIDEDKFSKSVDHPDRRDEFGLEDKLVLGFTGFMREWHGLEDVLELLLNRTNRHFFVVGDGPAREALEAKAKKLGVVDQVTITGVVKRDEISQYVRLFDIALQPDVVPYASPLKLFEYLALGRAIIAPDTENIREILEHGKNALLYNKDDKQGFFRLVEQLCNDEILRHKLGHAAKQTIKIKKLTWGNNALIVENLFKDLVKNRDEHTEV